MSLSERFSSALGRRDEEPNKAIALEIVRSNNAEAVQELIELLKNPANTHILADAIKVLEMIGAENPDLAKPAFSELFPLIQHPENKIVWRTMSALSTISQFAREQCFHHLGLLLQTMGHGSVITRDHGFKVLLVLYNHYPEDLLPILNEQILAAPDNQLGQYAEHWMKVIDRSHVHLLIRALEARHHDLTNPSHQKRISRVLRSLHAKLFK